MMLEHKKIVGYFSFNLDYTSHNLDFTVYNLNSCPTVTGPGH